MLRRNLGYTRTYARRMDLAKATPSTDLASTGYCLAQPGRAYLTYLPDGGTVTVDLLAARGRLSAEWFNPATGLTTTAPSVTGGATRRLAAPFEGDAVLFLSRD